MKTALQGKYSVTIASVTMEARIAFNRKSGYRQRKTERETERGGVRGGGGRAKYLHSVNLFN